MRACVLRDHQAPDSGSAFFLDPDRRAEAATCAGATAMLRPGVGLNGSSHQAAPFRALRSLSRKNHKTSCCVCSSRLPFAAAVGSNPSAQYRAADTHAAGTSRDGSILARQDRYGWTFLGGKSNADHASHLCICNRPEALDLGERTPPPGRHGPQLRSSSPRPFQGGDHSRFARGSAKDGQRHLRWGTIKRRLETGAMVRLGGKTQAS